VGPPGRRPNESAAWDAQVALSPLAVTVAELAHRRSPSRFEMQRRIEGKEHLLRFSNVGFLCRAYR
jgi:hypothetical protein